MIRYSSSVHKSDWECSSKSVRGSFFVNPLYIKNLTNLTNLTTLQTLQPYRFLCRVPKGPHAYLCTLHKGRLPAPCSVHNLCSLSENRGLPRRRLLENRGAPAALLAGKSWGSCGAAGPPFRASFAAFRRGCNSARLQFGEAAFRLGCNLAGFAHARTHGQRFGMEGASRPHARTHECSFSPLLRAFQLNWGPHFWKQISARLHGSRPVRNDGLEPCEPSKIKRTHRSRSFWLPRRRSVVFSCLLQAADCVPEMQHRGSDGLNGIVVQ